MSFSPSPLKAKSLVGLLKENADKAKEITSLKEQIAKLSHKSPVQTKPKRGLLANIRESVTSPRTGPIGRTLRRTVRVTPMLKSKPSI